MHKSINGLSILVAEQLDLDLLSGFLLAFYNRKRIKKPRFDAFIKIKGNYSGRCKKTCIYFGI
ncbi:MAG TPA: hypothetical protein ENK96_01915 [Desulfobulbaceae bacterium]|nr:hypothetical protein [Desulfobulbaceae bacterium]